MYCKSCQNEVEDCLCKDLNDRMRDASDSEFVMSKWCAKCDSYYTRCYCVEPDWVARTGGKLFPLPESRV